jgi:hypothetical protein
MQLEVSLKVKGYALQNQSPLRDVALRHRIRLDFSPEWSVVRSMPSAPKVTKPTSQEGIGAEICRLSGLPVCDLRVAWRAEFDKDPPKGLWRNLLLRTLAWKLQEKAFGGHDGVAGKLLAAKTRKDGRPGQRLKTGTVLIRDFQGVRHTVTLVPEGFVWQEKTYSSLSAIARIITGTNWNGPRFFGIREGRQKQIASQDTAA